VLPTIATGNVASAIGGAYEVANSCRFNAGDSAYMHKTPGGAGNRKTFTISAWCKRGDLRTDDSTTIFAAGDGSTADGYLALSWDYVVANALVVQWRDGGSNGFKRTTQVFRDVSAWYHIVVAVDTTQASNSNRMKIYVNGTQVTAFGTDTAITEDRDFLVNNTNKQMVGVSVSSGGSFGSYLNAYLSEVCLIDGSQLAPTSFGEFDEDSPTIWKPIDVSGLTFGTNGFYLDYEDSANLGNDANGGTDLTEVNLAATDQATDTPTNNFAVMNPLVVINGSTFSEGNCKIVTGSSPYSYDVSTIGVANGKWYVEAKYGGSSDDATFGIAGRTATNTTHELGHYDDTWSYYTGTGASNVRNNDSNSSYGATYTTNDIIGLALDLTNNKLYFSKNGTWQNSGDPESGSTGTGAVSITAASSVTDDVYYIGIGDFDGGASVTWEINFGNPSFSISSGNADANGYGNFEYAVPSGYLALCTKNLGSDGG